MLYNFAGWRCNASYPAYGLIRIDVVRPDKRQIRNVLYDFFQQEALVSSFDYLKTAIKQQVYALQQVADASGMTKVHHRSVT